MKLATAARWEPAAVWRNATTMTNSITHTSPERQEITLDPETVGRWMIDAAYRVERPSVTVVPSKYAKGWPRHDDADPAEHVDLGDALTTPYPTDAHATAYVAPVPHRVTSEIVDVACVIMMAVIVDVDGPDHRADDEWRRDFDQRAQLLLAEHPRAFIYHTRGGARIVWRVRPPGFVIESDEGAAKWSLRYRTLLVYLERRFGIAGDTACADWGRLFRLPHATRTPNGEPEDLATHGDAHQIGVLRFTPSAEDIAAARATTKPRRIEDIAPCAASGDGLLFHALQARGDVLRPHTRGAYVIRCPRESEHSIGRTGDGSTVLYLPSAGRELGAIHCLHASHAGFRVADWLKCFSDSELDQARDRAGIVRRRVA